MTFDSTYAPLFIAMIIGVAALVTFFAYRNSVFDKPYNFILPGLRFLALSFIGVLLVNPLVTETSIEEERPLLIWLQDESSSILAHKDSGEYRANYTTWQTGAIETLEEKYDVVPLGFGATVHQPSGEFLDETSALQNALLDAGQQSIGRNSAGIILASDGIVNSGATLSNRQSGIPALHVLALGDSTQYFDVAITNTLNNSIAFTGNSTPIRVDVQSKGGTARTATVTLKSEDVSLSQLVSFNNGKGQTTFEVSSDSAGTQRYEVEVTPLEGERNVSNNRKYVLIDFVEKKRSIHIIYNAPHPDVSAFRMPLLDDEANEVGLYAFSDWSIADSRDADLLVFHGLNPSSEIESIMENGRQSLLFMTTQEESYANWELAAEYIRRSPSPDRESEVSARFNSSFAAFQVDEDWIENTQNFPPIAAEVHSEQSSGVWDAVLLSNVGSVKTNTPIVSVYQNNNQRVAWVNGEGWWRWRAYSYSEYDSHQMFDGFIESLYRWLLSNSLGNRLEVEYPERSRKNESILFTVRPKDEAMNPLEEARVNLQIRKNGEVVFEQRLSENRGGRFTTAVSGLSEGQYSYTVTSEFGDETLRKTGEFFVDDVNLEQLDTRARFGQLAGVATANNGEFGTYENRDVWIEEIMDREAQVVLHEVVTTESLLKKWWPYVLIVLLLTAEWALRKREGQV